MADVQIRVRADSRNAQQEIQQLRREMQQLRNQLNQTQQGSNAAGQAIDTLGDESRQTAAQVGRLGEAISRSNRETQGITRGFESARGGTQVFTRSLSSLTGVLGGIGLAVAAHEVFQYGAESVRASVRVEGFRNSLTALYGDAQVANRVLADLQELSLLPGITFQSAVQGAVRLKTVGVEGARAEGVIREFGNAAALAGASTDEVGRSLVGLTQILSRGKISQEELNQILENLPLIGNSIREAFGSIDAEVIRDQLDAAGQSVNDFADILVNQLSMGARASADSTRNAFSNLENATFRLHAAIGDRLSPSVREATGFLTDLANTAADFVSGTDDATRSATSYANALMAASNAAAVNTAIQGRIEFLRQEKAALDEAAEGSANFFRLRGRETGAGAQYREITEELGELTAALTHTASAAEHFGNIQNQLLSEARDITQNITDLEVRRAGETARAYGQTTREIREQREALAETQKEIGENAVVLRALASANTVVTAATDESTAATKESTEATKEATVEILTYAEAIRQVQANIQAYVAEQALLDNFSEFWRIAASDAGDFENALAITVPTITNTEAELAALQGAFGANNDTINNAIGFLDGFTGDLDSLNLTLPQTTSEGKAVAQAFRDIAHQLNILERIQTPFKVHRDEINLINPAVSQAVESMRDYNAVLGTVQTEFMDTAEISNNLTDQIREQASAFDELRRSVDGVSQSQTRLPGQGIGSGVFDPSTFLNPRFDARTPAFTQEGQTFFSRRITGGDDTFANNQLALGRNLETFTEGFTVNINDIIGAVEGTISPLDALERSLISLDPSLAVLTTTVRLLFEEINEGERRRAEFRRTHDLTETQRGTFGRGRLAGLGSDTEFPGSSGRFQTRIGGALSLVQGTPEDAILSSLLNQISAAGADRSVGSNVAAIEMAYQPFIDSFERAMSTAGMDFRTALETGVNTESRATDFIDSIHDTYAAQIREIRAIDAQTGNESRTAIFDLVRERDRLISDTTNQLRIINNTGVRSNLTTDYSVGGSSFSRSTSADRAVTAQASSYFDDPDFRSASEVETGTAAATAEAEEVADRAAEVAERISDGQLSRSIRTASDTLNDLVSAGESVADLLIYINETLVPLWEKEYDDFIGDLVEQGFTLMQAGEIVTAEHGTRAEFTAGRTDAIITPITEANAAVAEQVAERVSDGTRGKEIGTATDTLNDMVSAGESVSDLMSFITMTLVPLWGQEYKDFIGDLVNQGFTLEQATQVVEAEHGTASEFTGNRTSAIIDPITEANAETARQVAERISDGTRGREISAATETLNDMVKAGGSVSDLQTFINTELVPLWGAEYDDFVDDLVDQGYTLADAQAIVTAEHGTRSEFTAGRTSAIITPITEANEVTARQVAERISDGMRGREIRATTGTLNDLIKSGTSVDDLLEFINTELVPLWEQDYDDIVDGLVEQGHTLIDAEAIVTAEQGTRTEFTAGRTGAIITPITEANQNTAQRVAEIVSDNTLSGNIRAATTGLQDLIKAGVSVSDLQTFINTELVPLWESQYQDMIDDLVDQGHTLADAERIVESQQGTVDDFIGTQTDAIITPITEMNQMTAEQVAERISDGTRGRNIRTTTNTLNDLVKAGASINDIQTFINTELVPLWRAQYEDMVSGLVEQGYTLADAQAIVTAEQGTADDVIGSLVSDIISPIRTSRSSTASALGQNQLRSARSALGGATSESDFETRRETLIGIINSVYDAEEARIRALDLTAGQLQDALEDNDFARMQALESATTATNTFAQDRIRAEERLQDDIDDLRDDALENERERQESLVELEEDTQDRITDIHRKANQSREDIQREFGRDFADTFRESQEAIAQLFADEGIGGEDARRFLAGFEGEARSQLSASGLERLREIQSQRIDTNIDVRRERDRDIEDVGIREGRQLEDVDRRHQEALIDINARAIEEQTALNSNIALLTTELSNINASETVVASIAEATTAAATSTQAAMTAATAAESGLTEAANAATQLNETVNALESTLNAFESITSNLSQLDFTRLADAIEEMPGNFAMELGEVIGRLLADAAEGQVAEAVFNRLSDALVVGTIDPRQFASATQFTEDTFFPTDAGQDVMADVLADVLDVNVVNPDDITSAPTLAALSTEIAELRAEGLNNREIGGLVREDLNALAESGVSRAEIRDVLRGEPLETRPDPTEITPAAMTEIAMPAPPTEFNVDSVSITAGSVTVSGGEGGGGSPAQQPAQQNFTFFVDLGSDGVMTELEGRLVQRSDEGLSELNV